MTTEPADLHTLLEKIRYDLTAAQAKLTDAFNALAELNLPDPTRATCPYCRLTFKGERTLAQHLYHTHDGPEPAHWLEAEARSA